MLAGVADQVSVVMRSTAIQLSTPDALRGRVSAVNFIFIGASNQLGAAESGFVAALTSPTFAVVSGGVGCLLVVALVAAARLPSCGATGSVPQTQARRGTQRGRRTGRAGQGNRLQAASPSVRLRLCDLRSSRPAQKGRCSAATPIRALRP